MPPKIYPGGPKQRNALAAAVYEEGKHEKELRKEEKGWLELDALANQAGDSDTEGAAFERVVSAAVQESLDTLPYRNKRTLELLFVEGRTPKEVGAV